MIFDLNDREKETLKNLNEIKSICDGILRRYHNGNTKFLVEDIIDIENYCNFIAEDNFNRLANEY